MRRFPVPGGSNRVKRGGSWNNTPHNLRSANRNNNTPGNSNNNLGFRLASTESRQQDSGHGHDPRPFLRPGWETGTGEPGRSASQRFRVR